MKNHKTLTANITKQEHELISSLLKKKGMSPCQFNLKLIRYLITNPKWLSALIEKI